MLKVRFLVTLLGVLLLTVASVQAQKDEQHCFARGDVFSASGALIERGDSYATCFDTIAEAIFAASGGAVQLPSNTHPNELSRELIERSSTADQQSTVSLESAYLLAIYWDGYNQTGSSLTITASQDCSIWFHTGYSSMPAGWDNRVSSTTSYSACGFNELSEHIDHSGSKLNCGFSGCSGWVGSAMDNQTSSTYLKP